MITELLLFWSVLMIAMYTIKRRQYLAKVRRIPGPRGYPLLGNALAFWGKPSEVFQRLHDWSKKYKRLVAIWIGPKLHVALFDGRDVEVVLKASRVMEKADEYRFLKPWLGDSILLSKGRKFRKNKKIVTPNFHINILKNYIDVFNEHAQWLVKDIEKEVGNVEFNVENYFYMSMLSILLETSMGVSHNTLTSEALINYAKAVTQLCRISHIRTYKVLLRNDLLFNFSKWKKIQNNALETVHKMTAKVIRNRKEQMSHKAVDDYEVTNTKKKRILLDLLLEAEMCDKNITEQEIMDEVLTMMFAGQDTTTTTLGFVLSLLGIHIDIQDRVYEELQEIFGDSDRCATLEDLHRMEYLERVIHETWRLYPPIPLIARKPIEDVNLETCTLPKGCTVAIIIMRVHRNPLHYENPHVFNPDNFLPEKVAARHPYSFIPFSAGVRTCVGSKYALLNVKVMLSTILRNYEVLSSRKEKDFVLVAETTLKRKEGHLIKIKPRISSELIAQII